ncbi:hypothetical protein FSPOR_11935 [Fusarium sporotrichioides]|uniref:Uncharacterized protein n=1 Tax=Fusarium sporotrichioides TaxID=5514 RepID=A0A395RD82_FUSSP|nr:hypothetical protein FSPOR_11935 [Fusarium sporotrichioides]
MATKFGDCIEQEVVIAGQILQDRSRTVDLGLSIKNPSIAIHPLLWTDKHLNLVGCNFEHVDHLASTFSYDHEELTRHAKCLATTALPVMKSYSAKNLLCHGASQLDSILYVSPHNLFIVTY